MKKRGGVRKGLGRPRGSKNKKPKLPATDVDESAVLTLHEVADYLHCHRATVHKLIQWGQIPCFRVGGDWRFLKSEIDKWIASGGGRRPSAQPAKPGPKARKPKPAAKKPRGEAR